MQALSLFCIGTVTWHHFELSNSLEDEGIHIQEDALRTNKSMV